MMKQFEEVEMEKSDEKRCKIWGPSASSSPTNEIIEAEPGGRTATSKASMMGFTIFLITTKTMTLIVYFILFIIANILLDISFFYTILSFGIGEFILIGLTIYHVSHPTLGVVFGILGSELILGATKFAFSISLELIDGGKNCATTKCSLLSITEKERFGLFWFCLITAFCDYFLSLIIISNSPQMYDFEVGDKYLF